MKRLPKSIIGVVLALALIGTFSCGDENAQDRQWDRNTPFMVDRTEPAQGDRNVPLEQPLRVSFTMPVDRNSALNPDNFKVEEMGENGDESLADRQQVNGLINLANGNMTIEFIPNLSGNQWQPNKSYMVTISQNLKSQNGTSLNQARIFQFTTGSTNTWGQVSVPGQPYVTFFDVVTSTPWGDNLAFLVEFNEDMGTDPNAFVSLEIFGSINNGMVPLIAWPVFLNSKRYWYLLFWDYGCAQDYFLIGQKLRVNIVDGRDITGEHMIAKEKSFWYLTDYWGGPCQ